MIFHHFLDNKMRSLENQFNEQNRIGKIFEDLVISWFPTTTKTLYLIDNNIREKYRENGRKFPDFTIKNISDNTIAFFMDAKHKKAYVWDGQIYFGCSQDIVEDYRYIARKYRVKVYIVFRTLYDPKFYDPNHMYVVNCQQFIDREKFWKNDHGKFPSWQWKIENTLKIKIIDK